MESANPNGALLKNGIILLIALILGGVGVYFSQKYIDDKVSFYRSQMEVKEEFVKAVVPKKDMFRGDVVLSQNLALRDFPKKYIDASAVSPSNYKVAIGQKLDFDIDQGKPLLWSHLDGGQTPTFSGVVEDGRRAMTIRVDEINSISGFLQPKDNVDLLLTYSGKEAEKQITFPFIQNLHVLATGVKTVTNNSGQAASKYNTITVQVSPLNAKKIILAQEVGQLTAVLRHPDDFTPMSASAVDVRDVLGDKAKPKARYVAPKKVSKGIEFIVGGGA